MTVVPRQCWSRFKSYVFVQCPKCQDVIRLRHHVANDGVVSPLLACRKCLWAGKIRLSEYRQSLQEVAT